MSIQGLQRGMSMRPTLSKAASGGGAFCRAVMAGLLACGVSILAIAVADAEEDVITRAAEGARPRPYVIDQATSERVREPSREAVSRPALRHGENDPAAVPPPSPVARPAAAGGVARGYPAAVASAGAGTAGCANPNALGVSREVEIDTTGGPRYGFQQYKIIDFLREGEVVLTFDDGPNPAYTKPILQALSNHCTKATFFVVGRNALAHPDIVRDEMARGHTVGNHTWSHANLGMRRIVPKRAQQTVMGGTPPAAPGAPLTTSSVARPSYPTMTPGSIPQQPTFAPATTPDKAKVEIEMGFSAATRALGAPMAPFFRFPYLGYSTAMHNYLAERNVAVFSIDVDSVDYRAKRAEDVINKVMSDLSHQRKGILLFHDIQPATAQAMPAVLDLLKAKGYRVVHIRPKSQLQTIAAYDARVGKDGVRMDAVAEKKPLVKRTMTWGMASTSAGSNAQVGTAAAAGPDDLARVRRPVARVERTESPGYVPARNGQPEILPWLTESRRGGM